MSEAALPRFELEAGDPRASDPFVAERGLCYAIIAQAVADLNVERERLESGRRMRERAKARKSGAEAPGQTYGIDRVYADAYDSAIRFFFGGGSGFESLAVSLDLDPEWIRDDLRKKMTKRAGVVGWYNDLTRALGRAPEMELPWRPEWRKKGKRPKKSG